MTTELAPIEQPQSVPALPKVSERDLYDALLAEAAKADTRKARECDLRDFAAFIRAPNASAACSLLVAGGRGQANAILVAYRSSMIELKRASSTVNRRLSTLRKVIELAQTFDLIQWNVHVKGLKSLPFKDTSGPGRPGWLRMFDTATRSARWSIVGKRNLAVSLLLHDHAFRRKEVFELDLAHWDAEGGKIWILRKGQHDRVPKTMNARTAKAISEWVEVRGPEPGPLFVRLDKARPKGQLSRLTKDGIYDTIRELGRQARVSKGARPHGLRHQAITRLAELTNGNLDICQEFAGHADPKTTKRYIDNRKDTAGEAAKLLGEDG